MGELNLMSPFDELTELRSVLTVQEIAEMTGLRRETLSRARPDSRFQRRTQKALDDLYAVVTRLRPSVGGDTHRLVTILRRPQATLGRRSIAELLQEGKVDEVLDRLPVPKPREQPQRPLEPIPDKQKQRAAELLAADPELAERLPAIEAAIRLHFGADAPIERGVIWSYSPGEEDELYVRVDSALSFEEKVDRLGDLLSEEEVFRGLLPRLTIGWV
ncbi:MAG TPA: hypothetical protein VHV53_00825 [Solirubrobacterales bacterium]|nr:hypothetical protein [Solirubrobacterales bacterium]